MNDDLQFRPMSKGLGFHPAKDTNSTLNTISNSLNKTIQPPKRPALTPASTLVMSKQKISPPVMLKRATNLVKTNLGAESTSFASEDNDVISSIKSQNPSLVTRFFSWIIDITALTILMGMSSMLIFQLNNFSWDEPMQFFQMDFFWNLYLPLGIGFYLFYFMLFERVTGQTLGKLILRLKVVKLNSDNPPSLVQCFLRNLFNIFSFATFGLLTVYDVVNWSLGLKVVKVKNK